MDDPPAKSNRRSARKPVLLTASVEVGGGPAPVKLRNLSEEGALIEGEQLPGAGVATWLKRGTLRIEGTIVWIEGNLAGLSFSRRLEAAEVLRHIPAPRAFPAPVHRRPGLTNHKLSAVEQRLLEVWAIPVRRSS